MPLFSRLEECGRAISIAEDRSSTHLADLVSPAIVESSQAKETFLMNIALVLIIIIAIVLAIVGGLNAALNWLLWVALIVGVIALIAFLFRVIGGRNRV
jgi:Flp pilus assembly protein protease CpaA